MLRYYSILGIDCDSDQDEIKAAFRRLAKSEHPDAGGDPNRFRDIKAAYDILSDPEKRRRYDESLAGMPFRGRPYRTSSPTIISEPVDIFDDIVDVFSRRLGIYPEQKIGTEFTISGKEARTGVNIELLIPIEKICQKCFGFGTTILSDCPDCRGSGSVMTIKKAYAIIEPGLKNGDVIEIRSAELEISGRIRVER